MSLNPPTRQERLLAFVETAIVLVQLTRDFAEHDDFKNGCPGEPCPWCYAMSIIPEAEQAEKDLKEDAAARAELEEHFKPNPPDAQPGQFYVAVPASRLGSNLLGKGYVHEWEPWSKRTKCGHWANPGWGLLPGTREQVTCVRCKG